MALGELHLAPWPETLPFDVWFVPEFPISGINHNTKSRPERTALRVALAENIRTHGLVNPLIVLNHPRPKCPDNWLMVGTNRLWALKYLGWTHAPAVVTGPTPAYPARAVAPAEVPGLFKDGRPYLSSYGIGLTGTVPPESFHYPRVK